MERRAVVRFVRTALDATREGEEPPVLVEALIRFVAGDGDPEFAPGSPTGRITARDAGGRAWEFEDSLVYRRVPALPVYRSRGLGVPKEVTA